MGDEEHLSRILFGGKEIGHDGGKDRQDLVSSLTQGENLFSVMNGQHNFCVPLRLAGTAHHLSGGTLTQRANPYGWSQRGAQSTCADAVASRSPLLNGNAGAVPALH